MRTTYILDTSVLVEDPSAYKQFYHSDVVIPITVLNELDKLKKDFSDAAKKARLAIRLLDELSELTDISTGVLIKEQDVLVKVDPTYYDLKNEEFAGFGDPTYGDTQILACAIANLKNHPTKDVIFVSNDINLRVKAKARGLDAISHEGAASSFGELYTGFQVVADEAAGLDLQKSNSIDPRAYNLKLQANECVLFKNENGDGIAMGRKVSFDKIKPIKKHYPWSISPRNKEQTFAIDLLMDKNVDLVTLIGKAGSGKSLIALASAIELVLNKKEYDKLIIYRPIQEVGSGIGYLPGDISEKLAPWFQAIMDSFEVLFSTKSGDWKRNLEMYQKKGQIEMDAIAYVRGRSIPNAIILIDEAQNLSKDEIKTLLTRAGEGTKVILTGDIEQIDNNKLDAINNGLSYTIEKFKDSELAGHITFTKGERSRLATLASNIL